MPPKLYDRVRPRIRDARTVEEAGNGAWPRDMGPDLTVAKIEYMPLWEQVSVVTLQPGVMDVVRRAWEPNGVYSTHSAYACRFAGLQLNPATTVVSEVPCPVEMPFLHLADFA